MTGNSGGPVIHLGPDSESKVIGIHGYGDQQAGVNMATSLGRVGNDPNFFRRALDAFENPGENWHGIVLQEETLIEGVLYGKRVSAV